MTKKIVCPVCRHVISASKEQCPHCGYRVRQVPSTIPRPSMPPPPTPMIMSAKPAGALSGRPAIGKKTLAGISAPVENPPSPTPRPPLAVPRVASPETAPSAAPHADEAWIPEPDDISQLVELEVDNTTDIDLSMLESLDEPAGASRTAAMLARGKTQCRRGARWVSRVGANAWTTLRMTAYPYVLARLLSPVFSVSFLQRCNEAKLPSRLSPIMRGMRWWHVAAAALGVLLLIAALSSVRGDAPEVVADASSDAKQPTSDNEASRSASQRAADAETDKAPPGPGAAAPQERASSSNACLPFGAYPSLPFGERLHDALKAQQRPGICDLFGHAEEAVLGWFSHAPGTAAVALDGVPGLRELVLATAEGRSDAPVASLWFYAGKLVAIRLQQHRDATRLDFDDVLAMLETEPEKQQSFTHGAGMQFDDRSMRVRYHFVAGRSLLVFSDRDAMRALDEVVQRREQALVKVSEGERQLQNRRLDAARSSFREAAQTAPSLGLPWLRLCEVSAQKEDFDAVQQAALEAEKISEDARVKAEAHAFIAMFRLWQGDVAQALDAWETASRLHPGAPRYSEAIDELRSGAFSAERVALTVARMSCMKQRGSTERGVLIRGNFKDTETYFAALRQVRTAEDFTQLEARFRKSECGP